MPEIDTSPAALRALADRMQQKRIFEMTYDDRDAVVSTLRALAAEKEAASAPTPDGWIEWGGGECPVAADALVEVRVRDGCTGTTKALAMFWCHHDGPGDIVAYRLVQAAE
jgi:hypothetical protein